MIDRFLEVLRAFLAAMVGNMEHPAAMLEETNVALQTELVQLRATLATLLAQQKHLEAQIGRKEAKQEDTSKHESSLAALNKQIEHTRERLNDLEQEVQKSYIKRQMLKARNDASREANRIILNEMENQTLDPGPAPKKFLVAIGVLFVAWLIFGVYVALRHMNL
jgi:phage shock protein A